MLYNGFKPKTNNTVKYYQVLASTSKYCPILPNAAMNCQVLPSQPSPVWAEECVGGIQLGGQYPNWEDQPCSIELYFTVLHFTIFTELVPRPIQSISRDVSLYFVCPLRLWPEPRELETYGQKAYR